jgi:nicotinamide-nucleotide amidase
MKCSILCIGNELLIGQVINTNAAWLGDQLSSFGFDIVSVLTVADEECAIKEHLKMALEHSDIVFTSGGLGPTKDDLTKDAIASFLGLDMQFHDYSWQRIQDYFTSRNYPISELHRQQCYMPTGSIVLENELGTAPGLLLEFNGKKIYILPGVPYELKHLFERHIKPELTEIASQDRRYKHTFLTVGTGETVIADHIEAFESNLPPEYTIAYLPSLGQVRIRLSGITTNFHEFESKVDELRILLKPWLYGESDENLESVIGKLLLSKKLMLATVESCTGGAIAARITAIPGASGYYKSSVIAYSNSVKEKILGVSSTILQTEGAVSEACVRAMVSGVLDLIEADIAIAVSGIAGPDGGTAEKPVGTLWIAVGNRDKCVAKLITFNKDRSRNIEYATVMALNMLRKFLLAI